jgi:hypothetical protein
VLLTVELSCGRRRRRPSSTHDTTAASCSILQRFSCPPNPCATSALTWETNAPASPPGTMRPAWSRRPARWRRRPAGTSWPRRSRPSRPTARMRPADPLPGRAAYHPRGRPAAGGQRAHAQGEEGAARHPGRSGDPAGLSQEPELKRLGHASLGPRHP